MLTRLNVSALIWGDFGLARAADDLVHTFAGRRPDLSPWKSYWAMGLCPDTPRKAIYTQRFRWAQFGLVARVEALHIWFYDQMLNICMKVSFYFFIFFIIGCKSWPAVLVLDQRGQSFDLHIRL